MTRKYRGKTVTKPRLLIGLGLPLSEKQIPQVVENLKSGGKPKETLERTVMRPRQVRYQAALRPDISSFFDFKLLLIVQPSRNTFSARNCIKPDGNEADEPALAAHIELTCAAGSWTSGTVTYRTCGAWRCLGLEKETGPAASWISWK